MSRPRLLHNIGSLGALHAANFGLTLVIIPHLTRVLGVQGWGEIVFVQLVLNYLVWLCNWSFYLHTTKKISAHRDQPAVLQRLFSTTLTAQWLLTIGAIATLFLLVLAVPRLQVTSALYEWGALLLLSNALQPLWFLNGMERIREASLIQIATKLIALPALFWWIRDQDDAHLYFLINGVAGSLTGLFCLYGLRKKDALCMRVASWLHVKNELRDGFPLFASTIWANLQGSIIPMGLGIFSGSAALGLYSLADRVRSAAIQVLHPITHALFPRMCHLFSHDPPSAFSLLKKSGWIILPSAMAISLILWLLAPHILRLLGGQGFEASAPVLAILAFSVTVMTASEFLIYQWLIPTNQAQLLNRSKVLAFGVSAALLYPFMNHWGAKGAAWLSLVSESAMTLIIVAGLAARALRKHASP